jgi:hypothetical protein
MSTRDVPGGKGGRCVRLTIYHHIVPMSRNLGALTLLGPSGLAWPVMGVLYLFYLKKRQFSKKLKTMCFNVFLQLMSEAFLVLRKPERDVIKNVNWSSCTVPVTLVRF